jgi:hypothetical protein
VKAPLDVAGSKLKEAQTPEASLSHLTLGHEEVTTGGAGLTKLGYIVFLTQSGESLRIWRFLAQMPDEYKVEKALVSLLLTAGQDDLSSVWQCKSTVFCK